MERASTIHIYTSIPPLTCDGRRESQHVNTERRRERKSTHGHKREKRKSTRGHKGGQQQFYNKLRKPGLELETLGSDTMLNFMH
jgi:hypothetical protein